MMMAESTKKNPCDEMMKVKWTEMAENKSLKEEMAPIYDENLIKPRKRVSVWKKWAINKNQTSG